MNLRRFTTVSTDIRLTILTPLTVLKKPNNQFSRTPEDLDGHVSSDLGNCFISLTVLFARSHITIIMCVSAGVDLSASPWISIFDICASPQMMDAGTFHSI